MSSAVSSKKSKSSTSSTTTTTTAAQAADVKMCVECEDTMAMMICPTCNDVFCALCYTWQHRSGKRTSHRPTALDGTPLATDATKKSLEGTTEHFVSQLERKSAPMQESSTSIASTKHGADADRSLETPNTRTPEDEARGEMFASQCEYIPLRLNDEERGLLKLLEAALKVSEYTDNVDVTTSVYSGYSFGYGSLSMYGSGGAVTKKTDIMKRELDQVMSLLLGMVVVNDYKRGQRLVENSFEENQEFFQTIFEIGRRFKIMNPDKMRTTYGKLMHILQDAVTPNMLDFNVVRPIKTVATLLRRRRGARALLADRDLPLAVTPLYQSSNSADRPAFERSVELKRAARQRLIERYGGASGTHVPLASDDLPPRASKKQKSSGFISNFRQMVGFGGDDDCDRSYQTTTALATDGDEDEEGAQERQPLSIEELNLVLDSIADCANHQDASKKPVDDMITLLQANFDANAPKKDESLSISYGDGGSKLSHSHQQQFQFVLQSLMLWREVQRQIFRLWLCADADLLSPHGYKLVNTGQGLNRLQPAPQVSNAMSDILSSVKNEAGRSWVGLSVVHLGDRDVPNALFFIDKYTQVPRILSPLVRTIDALPTVVRSPRMRALLLANIDGENSQPVDDTPWNANIDEATLDRAVAATRVRILRSFFRLGFNGDGSDGGSCIDGRLTSAWNWCSKLEGKVFWNIFQLAGFNSFDGSFRE